MLAARLEEQQPSSDTHRDAQESFAELHRYLDSSEARKMSESDLERAINQRGRELMRKLLQGHLDTRQPGETTGPVRDAEGVERTDLRQQERGLETIFGTVQVQRTGYAREGCESLHPLDAALNLPPERYSLEVRRQVAEMAASRSYDETLHDLSRHTGAEVPKRQAEELVQRAALDFDAFYETRREDGQQPVASQGSVLMITCDAKGVFMHKKDLREATRKKAELLAESRFDELPPKAEKLHRKRMATVAAVYTVEPFVRTPQEFLHSLMPAQPGAKPTTVRPRPVAKRVWASVEKETWQVILEALEEAGKRDPQRVKNWVVAVDGAEDQLDRLLEMAEAYDVKITLIVDIIHVTQYIWKAARAFFPNDRIELEYAAWANVKSVLEGKAISVARTLRRKATVDRLSADRRKPVDKCADYLLKYADHLQYDRYLAAGYPIATGVIEGACRYLVGDRMELTGARWRLKGAEAVLKLRALRASGDFDEYWTFHEAREYQRNHAQHYAGGSPPPMLEPATPQPRPRLRRVK